MMYTYDITKSKEDKCSTVCLTISNLLHTIINLFLSTFLVAHIYSLTSDIFDYAINVGIYQLVTYAVMGVSYVVFSIWVDRSNRIWCYRISNLFSTALVVLTIFYGEDLAQLVWLAGILNGMSHGAYYASYNVIRQEMVSRKSIGKYNIVLEILTKGVNVVFPILLGMLIEVSTFMNVAIYVCALCVVLIVITFFIKCQRPKDSSFNVIKYLKDLKKDEKLYKKIKLIYIFCSFYGFVTVLSSLLNINIMVYFGSSLSLGIITGSCAVLSAVMIFVVGKFIKPGKRAWLYILCASLIFAGALVFIIVPNMYTVIVYNVCMAISDAVIKLNLLIYRDKNLKEAGLYDDIAEHQCVMETIFQVVRCLAFGTLILVSLFKNYILFQILFVVFSLLYAVTAIYLLVYEKRYEQKEGKGIGEEIVKEVVGADEKNDQKS